MSVELRKSKLGPVYTIRYRDKNGRQVRETLGLEAEGWTKTRAKKVERERVVRGRTLPAVTWDFKSLSTKWFEETSKRKNWQWRTLMAYRRSIVRLGFFHDMLVHEISPKDVVTFIEKSKYAAKTTNDDISVLHGILDYAVRLEVIQTNPAYHAPRPKNGRKTWRILTPEEIREVDKAFLKIELEPWQEQWMTSQAQLMFRVLTRTGMRRGELRNLKVGDIDFDRRVIKVTDSKTKEGVRSIAIPESLSTQLKTWLSERGVGEPSAAKGQTGREACEGNLEARRRLNEASNSNAYDRPLSESYVFQSTRGNKVGGQWYTDQFNKALKIAGITDYVRPFHDMRHTALTNEAATGKSNPIALMAKAGHRSFKTTQEYIRLAGVVFHPEAEALEERLNGH